jgi:hypothetical protein
MKILSNKELNSLSTKRLLSYYKKLRYGNDSYYPMTEEEFEKYFISVKEKLNTKEHVERRIK